MDRSLRMQPKQLAMLALLGSFVAINAQSQSNSSSPHLIIVNANVRTMDQSRPTAEAIAVYGNRIMTVGLSKDIRKLAGAGTRIIDAQQQLVLPGFNDAHVHFLSGGFQLSSV